MQLVIRALATIIIRILAILVVMVVVMILAILVTVPHSANKSADKQNNISRIMFYNKYIPAVSKISSPLIQ